MVRAQLTELCHYMKLQLILTSVHDVLPAIHVLTGCDPTSKVGTKWSALKTAMDHSDLVVSFAKLQINDEMISQAECFQLELNVFS